MPVPGVLLAGGRGRRMEGRDKPFVEVAGRTLLDRSLARFAPQVAPLAVSGNGDPARFANAGVPVLPDADDECAGPLAGILAGMRWAKDAAPGAKRLATAALDAPFLPLDLVARLAEAGGDETLAVAHSPTGLHPVFALWPLALADDLAEFLNVGGRRVTEFADRHPRLVVPFPDRAIGGGAVDPFFNVNTPADAVRAEEIAMLRDHSSGQLRD